MGIPRSHAVKPSDIRSQGRARYLVSFIAIAVPASYMSDVKVND